MSYGNGRTPTKDMTRGTDVIPHDPLTPSNVAGGFRWPKSTFVLFMCGRNQSRHVSCVLRHVSSCSAFCLCLNQCSTGSCLTPVSSSTPRPQLQMVRSVICAKSRMTPCAPAQCLGKRKRPKFAMESAMFVAFSTLVCFSSGCGRSALCLFSHHDSSSIRQQKSRMPCHVVLL